MNYQETISWLYSQLPFYQKQGEQAYKKNIDNVQSFCNSNPHITLIKSIHVAGTNGKGSVSHMLNSVLQQAGYTVGLFTSPHIFDFRERIKINGKYISNGFIVDFVAAHKHEFQDLGMSFFEMSVVMALNYFSLNQVDVAIIEVGLGGRLDATNIINPELSIITNTSIDHTNLLGPSLESITKEKAGIIKHKTPVLVGEVNDAFYIIENMAKKLNAPIYCAQNYNYSTDLQGEYQIYNINTAVSAVQILRETGYVINEKNLISGLDNVVNNTGILGRWQVLTRTPLVICDIAHNMSAIQMVVHQLLKKQSPVHMIIGFASGKEIEKIIQILPRHFFYCLCGSSNSRILNPKEYSYFFDNSNLEYKIFDFSFSAYDYCLFKSVDTDIIFITGSTFIVSDILKYLDKV